jgi:prepilin-type N-terminal cleavage/methylation domain-containing protein
MKRINKQAGFTLLEILLVVGIIAILAGIVILAINPTKQLGDTRNAQRRSDVLTILNAVYQFSIDHNGRLPGPNEDGAGDTEIPDDVTDKEDACVVGGTDFDATEIARNDADGDPVSGAGEIDLWPGLVQDLASTTYLVALPADPTREEDEGTGYHIFRTTGGRVTVCAPHSENGVEISVTR